MKKSYQLYFTVLNLMMILSLSCEAQWQQVEDSSVAIASLTVSGGNILAATYLSYIYLSPDNGNSWILEDSALTNGYIVSLITSGSCAFAGGNYIYRSCDNGYSWLKVTNQPEYVNSLAANDSNIFGVSLDIIQSSDNGNSWVVRDSGKDVGNILAIAANGKNIYVGTEDSGIFISKDNGISWKSANNGLKRPLETVSVLATNGTTVFAGIQQEGIYYSTDSGNSWLEANNGFNLVVKVGCFLFYDSVIFAGTDDGLYLSFNNGNSWMREPNFPESLTVNALTVNDSDIFAGTYDGGIWRCSISDILLTSIKNISSINSLTISPNPVQSELRINTLSLLNGINEELGIKQVDISNVLGQSCYQFEIENSKPEISINVSMLPAGVYFVRVSNEAKSAVLKFVKD